MCKFTIWEYFFVITLRLKQNWNRPSSLDVSVSYHRTIRPCSKKFFKLGSVCCRSGVVKLCWYLSCETRKQNMIIKKLNKTKTNMVHPFRQHIQHAVTWQCHTSLWCMCLTYSEKKREEKNLSYEWHLWSTFFHHDTIPFSLSDYYSSGHTMGTFPW